MRREVREVGPDDVIESDVDPHECATCHRGCWWPLCDVGPEGKVNRNFGIRQLKWQEVGSHYIMNSRVPKTRSPGYRKPESLENWSFEKPEKYRAEQSSENSWNWKHFHKLDCLWMMKNCQENEGLTNSSCMRVILQKTDECQNYLEIASNAKKWKRHIMLPVQKTKLRRDSVEL